MKIIRTLLGVIFMVTVLVSTAIPPKKGKKINPEEVKEIMQKVANWQILHVNDFYSGWKDLTRLCTGQVAQCTSAW